MTQYKYIIFRGTVLTLTLGPDNLWRAPDGCIMALTDDTASVDEKNNCGVSVLSLPDGHPLNALCSVHDYMYSSPAYQLFHSREQADSYLEYLISQYGGGWSFLAEPFYWLCRWLGGEFWENPTTR